MSQNSVIAAQSSGNTVCVPDESGLQAPSRILIERPAPAIDGGRYPAKRCAGDLVEVSADIIRDGHQVLRAVVRHRRDEHPDWIEAEMIPPPPGSGSARWHGSFHVGDCGRWQFTIAAWSDPFASWQDELRRKLAAGRHQLDSELTEGAAMLEATLRESPSTSLAAIAAAHAAITDATLQPARRHEAALAPALSEAMARHGPRRDETELQQPLTLQVDRPRARFSSWYELFPRSFGGLAGVRAILDDLQRLGFDVVYLTPIHPIGTTNRKGSGGALLAGPDDPGSPWAIGGPQGGHTAIHPDLGTLADFEDLTAAARSRDMDIALDFAIQCSADHPWLTEHPEWFQQRPDRTLKYAENPPKAYQDIYNLDFDCPDWRELWLALRDIVAFWIERGVRVFRVDNPHTKPLPFWAWLLAEVRRTHPETIFLAEAFTHRALMQALAKVGFSQSYTYFTWKHSRSELTRYVEEMAHGEEREYLRPNFFVNTPDILTEYLQHGGRPAFQARLILAATLSPSYGIYSGFENIERTPAHPGSEEYLHSEKYEIRHRTLDGELLPLIARLNAIRRESPALQRFENVTFLPTENDALIAYAKRWADNTVIVVVNIDFTGPQEGLAIIGGELGLPDAFRVEDLLSGERHDWRTGRNYVRLHPPDRVAHMMRVLR